MRTTNSNTQRRRDQDTLQFRFLMVIAFAWFFITAVTSKLTLGLLEGCDNGESCFRAAMKNAYSVVPYVFMRV
jgi:hypothetical protein